MVLLVIVGIGHGFLDVALLTLHAQVHGTGVGSNLFNICSIQESRDMACSAVRHESSRQWPIMLWGLVAQITCCRLDVDGLR
jgi:hypothetical protein